MKKFVKGMVKDPERVDQPEATYRDALNANLYIQKGAIVNEYGNKIVANIDPSILNIIGQCPLEDGRIVLFAKDSFGDVVSIISPKEQSYKVLYRNNALNFNSNFPIEATAKVNTQGDILVYFTDNYLIREVEPSTEISYIDDFNPPRVINISRQLKYSNTPETLYGNIEYTVFKLDLFLNAGLIPEFNEVKIENGGGVVSGTYHLALAYSDEDKNTTNYLVASNAVHLVTTPENTVPTEVITGNPQGSQSKKAITWEVIIPEQVNYSHVKPVVIQRFGGGLNQEASEFAYQLQEIKIPNYSGNPRQFNITYTGLETIASEAVEQVVIDTVRYESAKTLVQLNNQLYLSNLASRGDLGYQRFANNIELSAVTEKIERFDPRYYDVISLNKGYSWFKSAGDLDNVSFELEDRFYDYKQIQRTNSPDFSTEQSDKFFGNFRKGYKDPKLFYKKKSYKRSEVYAFYISFVLNDGTESYAYHIPGREALQMFDRTVDYFENDVIPTSVPAAASNNLYNIFDRDEVPNVLPNSKFYQLYDTQLILSQEIGVNVSTNFWENVNEFYPDTEDFSIWSTTADGIPIQVSDTLQNKNVRHHKMPSNKHDSYKFIGNFTNSIGNFEPTIYQEPTDLQEFKCFEDINILGIKLSNIRIPKFILKQVQGYKVYYAKRTQQNKTILGQSISVPGEFQNASVLTMDRELATHSKHNKSWFMSGVIPSSQKAYLKVDRSSDINYPAVSMFGFHDFNLLKNKHTLSGASHVDVQSILVMRHYRGGPGINKDIISNVPSYYFPDWLNSELGNITDPEGGEVADITTNALKTKNFLTSVMLASAYFKPGDIQLSNFERTPSQIAHLTNINTVYTIKPKSITYLPGNLHLKTSGGTEFHGVNYLYNFAGESQIAVGLTSGMPMLPGWTSVSQDIVQGDRFAWYASGGYLDATDPGPQSNNSVLNVGLPYVTDITDTYKQGGWPAVYLLNICALKSDVYKSFDEQELVWTGYYKNLSDVDKTSGIGKDINYFQGAESDNIFGGDTYIGRYSFRTTGLNYGHSIYTLTDIPLDQINGTTAGEEVLLGEEYITVAVDNTLSEAGQEILEILNLTFEDAVDEGYFTENSSGTTYWNSTEFPLWSIKEAWRRGTNTPRSTLFSFMCESDDLLGFRHQGDQSVGVDVEQSLLFDASTANSVIFNSPLNDNTHMDNLLYMTNYSLNQDIRVAIPFPKKLNDVTAFPNRTIRSSNDEGSIPDKYRHFLALEFKDIPKNRGDITKLFTLGSILYLLTERSLFVTRGKQEIQLGDNTQAYVGSGNIFEQNPDEVIPTTNGYGGCDSQFTALTTRYGQFYLNRRDKKAYMYTESIIEISSLGMEKWFLDNIPFQLEQIGVDLEQAGVNVDAPTADFGFVATYDPKFKRIILTKREKIPTNVFLTGFNSGNIILTDGKFYDTRSEQFISFSNETYFVSNGWTISFFPETQAWASKHSYIPRLYASTAEEYYSLVNYSDVNSNQVWEHSDFYNPCNFFSQVYPFEFEYIDNTNPGSAKIFSNIYYWADVVNPSTVNFQETFKKTSTGFTDFYVYNTNQISSVSTAINYLSNARLVDKVWYINDFRDMSRTTSLTTSELVTGIPNVTGSFTTSVVNSLDSTTMFIQEGQVNPFFINTNKSWFEQKRFVDHYLGIRLISDNSNSNLIYLYAAGTKHRQSFR